MGERSDLRANVPAPTRVGPQVWSFPDMPPFWARAHGGQWGLDELLYELEVGPIRPSGDALLDQLCWEDRDPKERRAEVAAAFDGKQRPQWRPIRPFHAADAILLKARDVSVGSPFPRLVLAPAYCCAECGGRKSKLTEDGIRVCCRRKGGVECGTPWRYEPTPDVRPLPGVRRGNRPRRGLGSLRVVENRRQLQGVLRQMRTPETVSDPAESAEFYWDRLAWLAFCRAAYDLRTRAPLRVVATIADREAWGTPRGKSRRRWGTRSVQRALDRARNQFLLLLSMAR